VKKNKLSKNQYRRIQAHHQYRLHPTSLTDDKNNQLDDAQFGEPQQGVVISRFGQHADVEGHQGQQQRCHIRRNVLSLVTGDRVIWRPGIPRQENRNVKGIVEAVHERKSVLTRPDFYDGLKPMAANIDQIVIVSAVIPDLSLNMIDRYLVVSESLKIKPLLLLNKIDLLTPNERKKINLRLNIYRNIHYTVLEVSAQTGEGIADLQANLLDRVSIFSGQSGVGKSSLLNTLLPPTEQQILVEALSEKSALGQHTTTISRLYHFQQGGDLIDSPGIRGFGLWHLTQEQIIQGFIEFRDYVGHCKFRDCEHIDDPCCALRDAVQKGHIAKERFDNYHQILSEITSLKGKKLFNQD